MNLHAIQQIEHTPDLPARLSVSGSILIKCVQYLTEVFIYLCCKSSLNCNNILAYYWFQSVVYFVL